MLRAVIYARYSTDKQRESSIEDQARVCRGSADALRAEVVAVHADDGVSGSTPVGGRIGGRTLLVDALAGRFEPSYAASNIGAYASLGYLMGTIPHPGLRAS